MKIANLAHNRHTWPHCFGLSHSALQHWQPSGFFWSHADTGGFWSPKALHANTGSFLTFFRLHADTGGLWPFFTSACRHQRPSSSPCRTLTPVASSFSTPQHANISSFLSLSTVARRYQQLLTSQFVYQLLKPIPHSSHTPLTAYKQDT